MEYGRSGAIAVGNGKRARSRWTGEAGGRRKVEREVGDEKHDGKEERMGCRSSSRARVPEMRLARHKAGRENIKITMHVDCAYITNGTLDGWKFHFPDPYRRKTFTSHHFTTLVLYFCFDLRIGFKLYYLSLRKIGEVEADKKPTATK